MTSSADRVHASFLRQAQQCRELGSPFTQALCTLLAERLDRTTRFGARILDWEGDPGEDALPLRAAGALHALARSGRAPALTQAYPPNALDAEQLWRAVAAAIREHDTFLHDWLDSAPQTNEVARSTAILVGCLAIAVATRLPLSILEIGASAGLNLGFDRYRYLLGPMTWGDPAAPVEIRCAWRGGEAPLDQPLDVTARAACDLNPLDPDAQADRERLLSYIWADQEERLARTTAALDTARAAPWRVERADAGAWVERHLGMPPVEGRTRVLLHTIVWQYLPAATKERIERALARAGDEASPAAPLAWLRLEPRDQGPGGVLALTLWPGGEEHVLGRADYHGRWIHWAPPADFP